MKKTVFISHAAPEDNLFTRWLGLQLIGLGYTVWTDVLKLKGGEDWWKEIEYEIRENTKKFILVLSSESNRKDGVLKELAVAQKAAKKNGDERFIIPVIIDADLPYDEINIELNRLNAINFRKSWTQGLNYLIERLEEDGVVKDQQNYTLVKSLWETIVLQNKSVLNEQETYTSNWFPIVRFPEVLRFHKFKYAIPQNVNIDTLKYPAKPYKEYLATFAWCYDFMDYFPKTTTYSQSNSIEIQTESILDGSYNDRFISNRIAKNILIDLLNSAFESFLQRKGLSLYEMSNRNSFWLKKDVLEKDKYDKVLLVGKQKEKHWHYAISGSIKLFPEPCFVINSHIWFTFDGQNIIPIPSRQHTARRKQGKNWWNNDWRKKLHALIKYLADGDECITLELGSEEIVQFSIDSITFDSPVKYTDPNIKEALDDDSFEEDEIEFDNYEEEESN